MDTKRSIKILIIFIVLLILGVLIIVFNGFKLNSNYENAVRIEIAINKQLDINEINTIVKEVYSEEQFKVEMVGAFKDTIGITMKESNEEKNKQLIIKLNEKYNTELETTDISIYNIQSSNLYDIVKPYIWPTAISFAIILAIYSIIYRKKGFFKFLLTELTLVIGAEILYSILVSIFNIKVSQTILIGAVAIMLFVTVYLAKVYEKIILQNSTKKVRS